MEDAKVPFPFAVEESKMNILLVEDDIVDRKAIRRALRDNAIDATLVEAGNGAEAFELLHEDESHSALPKPLMILLDINMPQMGGHEFLHKLRNEESKPEIRDVVVFVLTTSQAEEDRKVAYEHHVAGYIVKTDYEMGLSQVVNMLDSYESVVEFP